MKLASLAPGPPPRSEILPMPLPLSPDLSPMDYSIWSILESKACANSHSSIDTLMTSLNRECGKIPQETLRATVEAFPCRLKALIKKNGGYIE